MIVMEDIKLIPPETSANRGKRRFKIEGKLWRTVENDQQRINLKFKYSEVLIDEIRSMAGAKWNPTLKSWSFLDTGRNNFQLDFLLGKNPYQRYDQPLITDWSPNRECLYNHQSHMARHVLTYHDVILAAEMGTGKTLSLIEVLEALERRDVLWIGPRPALEAVELEFRKWAAKITPVFITYDKLKSTVENWPSGQKAPSVVVMDESSRVKSPTAQRSDAAFHLAESVRKDWGDQGYVVEMTGSPAPKSPVDWWMQCEIARPGFLKEGTAEKFRRKLGLIVDKVALTGGTYPSLLTWLDDEKKCGQCGQYADHANHNLKEALFSETTADFHTWQPSVNEIDRLYRRMKGLVLVYFKKDCLDLPDKRYRIIECPPTQDTLNAAKLIAAGSSSTILGLTRLRELSDGFQYTEEITGYVPCPRCEGKGVFPEPCFTGAGFDDDDEAVRIWESEEIPEDEKQRLLMARGVGFEAIESSCSQCEGACEIPTTARQTTQVPCPKETKLIDIFDTHDDDGRLVVYGGFTGTLDRISSIASKLKWEWIRVDGRGWHSSWGAKRPREMLEAFQDSKRKRGKLVFIGHPGSAGMGLTLTESCEIVYYSNDFNAESRIQSEDRIHRPGMDKNKGALITDLVHLPTDLKVIENLKLKRRLQDLSLGQFADALRNMRPQDQRVA